MPETTTKHVRRRCRICGKAVARNHLCASCGDARERAWDTQTRFMPGTAINQYHGHTGRDDI